MKRLTRRKDSFECRFLGGCPADTWMMSVTKTNSVTWGENNPCDACPFEKYINRLAELEDEMEKAEDDGK